MDRHRKYRTFDNKYGRFSDDGREFIITRPDTPRPWTNIISNGDLGIIVSQAGSGFTWRTHVNLNRLTRWTQDLICDHWGKWLYLRDVVTGELVSLSYQPIRADYKTYEVHHGLGYSIFDQEFKNVRTSWTIFAALEEPVEIWICNLKNTSDQTRTYQLASYIEWDLGSGLDNHREFHKLFIETRYDPELRTISAVKNNWIVPTEGGHWNKDWPFVGFHSINQEVCGWDASKDVLLGRNGDVHRPHGIEHGLFKQSDGKFQDPVASLATMMTLAPDEEKTVVLLLGQAGKDENGGDMAAVIKKFATEESAKAELEKIKLFWSDVTDRTHIETPDDSFDLMSNIWLKYQAISAHMWARTGYYQQSGAYGFRDQLQTSQIWLPIEPAHMLEHVKLCARHQFEKGTVLHWWHPMIESGLQTDMTDDLLWLPFMLVRYFNETGDYSVLRDVIPFFDNGEATLQEHCTRAIGVALDRFSERGIPLIGAGDWCDGFSAVGLKWKGESVWLGMFLYDILLQWSDILEKASPDLVPELAHRYRERAERLKEAINNHGWNGEWYIAATKDDGTPIGDPSQSECKIFLNSQTWAVMTDIADEGRKKRVIQAMMDHLESDNGLMLLYPAFRKPDNNIGYITRYTPGLRENGGVYTHAATWGVLALAKMGMADDAIRIFNKLNPILQCVQDADRYVAEPYVLPGNIDGKDSQYYGRAGWTWYTGSAGWLATIALEYICGVRPMAEGLLIDPCIPSHWPEVKIRRKFRNGIYDITIENPDQNTRGVKEILINDTLISGNVVPPQGSGTYTVKVRLNEK
ncbi:glycosyl transferase family 36 [candidate division KSB1 bacterium]|nr:glycosyl transferase family 36 [candidate division KSB1 bacterium]